MRVLPVVAAASFHIIPFRKEHFLEVAQIYQDGMDSMIATFETSVPDFKDWNAKFIKDLKFVATSSNKIVGWAAVSLVSMRKVYKGVAETTVYVKKDNFGEGIGTSLLHHLITKTEEKGFWTLQANIFPQNIASLKLHHTNGFRIVGRRRKIAQRDGQWFDNILMERRSKLIQ